MAFRVASIQESAGLWPLRALWLALPVVVGFGLGDVVGDLDQAIVAEVLLWATWFVGLVACLVPGPASLTIVRVLAPATVGVTLVAGVLGGDWSRSLLALAGYGIVVSVVSELPVVGDRMINGSAYGSERRMAIRPPGFAILGPIQVAWLLLFLGALGPSLLAATGRWPAAAVAVPPGAAACWLGWRVLHQLSRRWLVFVPAGFVIHDHVMAAESILLRRSIIDSLGPATVAGVDRATDLSGGASGLALEVAMSEPVPFTRRGRRELVATEADHLVFTPTLPGAVLTEARIRAIRIST